MSPKDLVSAGGVSAQQLAEIGARLKARYPEAPTTEKAFYAALDDLAALVEAVKALRAALEPFAQAAMAYSLELAHPDSEEIETVAEPELTVGDLRRAAAVLGTP